MPSFDIVSEIDLHELSNAIDQSNREIDIRFDFKGTNSKFEYAESLITLKSENEFQLNQMLDILKTKLSKRSIDLKSLDIGETKTTLSDAKLEIKVKQGIEQDAGKSLVKIIKSSKLKVQASIQGDKVRVTGKKRDDLQQTMTLLKESKVDLPLQFENFRD